MSNIATAIRAEITRLSRRELKISTDRIKKTSAQHRSDIASLKRRLASIEQYLKQWDRVVTKAASASGAPRATTGIRYSAKGFQAQRRRLALSAADIGFLLNISGPTIYNWEAGKTRPRPAQMPAIVALRKLSKRSAQAILKQQGK
ncbi:MAG: hypothetical protein NT159_07495 [Proteobacteria bacterium]|nr:hypothetical protein [Pseudomonadota bacterium]